MSSFRPRFFYKLYAGFVTVILLTTVVITATLFTNVTNDALRELEDSLRAKALLLDGLARRRLACLATGEGAAAESIDGELGKLGGGEVRLTILDEDGRIVADSATRASAQRESRNEEILSARDRGEGSSTRRGEAGGRTRFLARALVGSEGVIGFVRASTPLAALESRLASMRRRLVQGAALAVLTALVLGFILARWLARPLREVAGVAASVASGNLDARAHVSSRDEIGQLASSFNTMAAELVERLETTTRDSNKVLTILSGMVEGVIAVDPSGRIIHMNAAAGRILQASPQSSSGRRLWEVTRVPEVSKILQSTLSDGVERQSEARLGRRPGGQVIEIFASSLRDGAGRPGGAVAILHDVTRLRRLESLRRDFVANASHELKTPLTVICGLLDTLEDNEDMEPETRRRFLDKLQKQAGRLSSLISDLLVLSKIETQGEKLIDQRELDLRRLSLDFEQRVRAVAEDKGIEVQIATAPGRIPILADEESIRAIVGNLLDNAVKYTPPGGRVTLRISAENGFAVIDVEDTGIGIRPEHQERVFERFYRVDKARSRDLGGTGLGLSIVKHYVAALGGEVSVESVPGRGSLFRVQVPLAESKSTGNSTRTGAAET